MTHENRRIYIGARAAAWPRRGRSGDRPSGRRSRSAGRSRRRAAAQCRRSHPPCRSRKTRAVFGATSARLPHLYAAGRTARQDRLPRPQLPRTCPGRPLRRQFAEIPNPVHALPQLGRAAYASIAATARVGNLRLRGRACRRDRQARETYDARQRAVLRRRLYLRQRGLDPRIPAPHHAMAHGQERREASDPGW